MSLRENDTENLEEPKGEHSVVRNHDNSEPPDGGKKAWACVVSCFLFQFCSFGYVNACGIFQLYYHDDLLSDQTSSALAWITTLQIFLLFMFGPIVGKFIDAYGSRKILLPFSVLEVFAVCMLSLCRTYWQVILAQGVTFGIAASGLSLPAMTLATQCFSTKRGLAVGIVASGSSLGGVIYPVMLPKLIDSVGFASAVRWTALMQAILLVVANILCFAPFPPKGGAPPNGDKKAQSSGLQAFKSWPWAFFILGCFFTMWGLFAPLNYLPEMAASHGLRSFSHYTLSIANAGSIVGRIVPGWASDRIGQFNAMILVTACSGILVLAAWLPLDYNISLGGMVTFGLLYGFVSGGFVSIGPPCVVSLAKGRVDEIGLKLGGFCLAIALGALTGLPISGAIKDAEGDGFAGLMCFVGVTMLIGSSCMGVARVLVGGRQILRRV